MASGHMNIRRIIHRILEEIEATKHISEVTSLKEGIITFLAKTDIQIMNHNGYYEWPAAKRQLIHKHEIMLKYYEQTFGEFLNNYNYINESSESKYADHIWVCWWQGIEKAPEIVKKCIDSIKKNAGTHPVIIITEENYKDYVDIPKWVEEKKNKGIITKTNYSDLLRLSLLAKYGGMWLDSTFFCAAPVLDQYFNEPLWSIKRPDYFHASVASGYFAGYSLACNEDNRYIFTTIRDFFLHYWEHNDSMVDYLMVDYMVVLAQRHDHKIKKAFEKIQPNNPSCDELFKVLGQPFDPIIWDKLRSETALFKLTWKQSFPLEKNGKPTFYKMLMLGKL